MKKDSFILYTEQQEVFDNLSDEEAGQLIKAIFNYVETGEASNLNKTLNLAFIPIRQNIDRNSEKWEETKNKRSEAGKKSAEIRKQQKSTNSTSVNFVKSKSTNSTSVDFVKNKSTNSTVNVNDNVNVNVNKKENIKEKEQKIHFAEFVTMTNAEHEKLVSTYGKEFADQCIEVLDNYKGSSGKKYKSDYRAILTWVVDEVKKRKKQTEAKQKTSNFTSRSYENLNDLYFNTGQKVGKNE